MGANSRIVEAIMGGKIVRVSEEYARLEGLPIIRHTSQELEKLQAMQDALAKSPVKKGLGKFDEFRKPLKITKKSIVEDLVNNFHWILNKQRRDRNLTRRQLAHAVGASEYEIKMIENGLAPSEDFILISKLEQFYQISLRKNSAYAPKPRTTLARAASSETPARKKAEDLVKASEDEDILGDSIEIDTPEDE